MVKLDEMVEMIENPTANLFLTPGNKTLLIGSQDGSFVAFGHHIEDEMGGLWMQPIKLLDGFWLGFNNRENNTIDWLDKADEFVNYPYFNEHIYYKDNLIIKRTQFSPDDYAGFIVNYEIKNISDEVALKDVIFVVRSDLRPVWYSETADIYSGQDEVISNNDFIVVKDSDHDWFVGIEVDFLSSQVTFDKDIAGKDTIHGLGVGVKWESTFAIEPQEIKTITIRIAGSIEDSNEIADTLSYLKDSELLFNKKKAKYSKIISQSDLICPDKELEYIYAWVKCHTEWLSLDVPNFGKAITAGIPEYTWWFGTDSAYAILGILPAGFHELSKVTQSIIKNLSIKHNGNGRIIHEANTFGFVGNPGNTQETAHYIVAVKEIFNWTGDIEWLESHYSSIKEGLKWLLEEKDEDKDLFPEGYGIIEILGLNGEMIDTTVYTYQALTSAAKIANIFDDSELSNRYRSTAHVLLEKIKKEMWLEEEGLFGDLRISGNVLFTKIDKFIEQEKMGNDKETIIHYLNFKNKITDFHNDSSDRAWCFKNWVINTPLEMGLASDTQAEKALSRLNSEEFIGDYGMRLSGIPGESGRRMMTISSAVQIQANLTYRKTDEAFHLMKKVLSTFGKYLPGSISEMSPNYGCFVQAWTSYAILNPVIKGFVGIRPDAINKTIHFSPQLPKDWENLTVNTLMIGTNEVNVFVYKTDLGYDIDITSSELDWTFSSDKNVKINVL